MTPVYFNFFFVGPHQFLCLCMFHLSHTVGCGKGGEKLFTETMALLLVRDELSLQTVPNVLGEEGDRVTSQILNL